jgi:hypothetical protein
VPAHATTLATWGSPVRPGSVSNCREARNDPTPRSHPTERAEASLTGRCPAAQVEAMPKRMRAECVVPAARTQEPAVEQREAEPGDRRSPDTLQPAEQAATPVGRPRAVARRQMPAIASAVRSSVAACVRRRLHALDAA